MNNYYLETEDSVFRPVRVEDAEFIVYLRNLPHAKSMIHETSTSIDNQRDWIEKYLKRDNDYYWITETKDGIPTGTVGLYNYNAALNQIESGRWISIYTKSGDTPLSGHVLLKDFAFSILKVSKVVCDTAVINKQVLKFHRFLGERMIDKILDEKVIDGKNMELVWFEETAERWKENRKKLVKFCGKESDRRVFHIEPDGSLIYLKL